MSDIGLGKGKEGLYSFSIGFIEMLVVSINALKHKRA